MEELKVHLMGGAGRSGNEQSEQAEDAFEGILDDGLSPSGAETIYLWLAAASHTLHLVLARWIKRLFRPGYPSPRD